MKLLKYLKKYEIPGTPIFMTNPKQLYNHLKTKGYDVTLSYVKQWVQDQRGYSLYKESRRKFSRIKTILKYARHLYDIDLLEVSEYASSNNGVRYLLVVIDGFNKYASVRTLKTKTASEVKEAVADIFDTDGAPEVIRSDAGKEFVNSTFKEYLKSQNVRSIVTHTTDKAYYVERFNRTLKRKIQQFITQNNTHHYIQALPKIVKSYNSSVHRSIGVPPETITRENSHKHWWRIYKPKKDIVEKKFTLRKNDTVRISFAKNKFSRAYDQTYSEEIFKITARYKTQGIPQYRLEDLKGEPVKGSFYASELQKVSLPDYFPVEKILRKKTVKGKVFHLVKYLGYSEPEWTEDVQPL